MYSIKSFAYKAVIITGTIALFASRASAVDGRSGADALDEIVILAQRTTLEAARAAQKAAPNLVNLMTADEMSRLPDINTGEAVRRIPGISLETDTGEGRYINIRGLDADLNSTTFGGLRLPPTNNSSPSGAGRAVAFDSIPSGFVGAITVTKSNLPEQDAEAIGGTIDITPKTAPPDGRPFADLKIGTGQELQRHTWITDLAGTAGTRFGGRDGYSPFSLVVIASTYTDRRGIDDAEAGFVDHQATGIPDKAFSGFEQRYYRYHRERHGYGIDLGYAPDKFTQYFIRAYDAGYSEAVIRNRLVWNFNGPSSVDTANPNGFIDTVKFAKSLRDEKEFLDSKVFEIGGKNIISDNTLDYHVGYTKGTYNKPFDYNSTFTNPALANASYDNATNPNWPVFKTLPGSTSSGTTSINPTDPIGYVLSGIGNSSQHSNDHELAIGTNLKIPTHYTDRSNEEFKFGLNARIRDKTGDQTSYNDGSALGQPLSSLIIGNDIRFYQGHYLNGPNIDAAAIRAIYAADLAAGAIATDPFTITNGNAVSNQLASVHDKENVYAAYGQYQFGWGPLGIVAGIRIEKTKATYAGYKSDTSDSFASANCPILSAAVPAENTSTPPTSATPATHVCAVSQDNSYTNFFPTAQARYEFTPDLVARAAISSTIARPGFQQVTAATIVDSGGNISTGNPGLKPTRATGLDVAIERYLSDAGIASFGFFYKDIHDYIVTNGQQVVGGPQKSGGNLGIVDIFSYSNAPHAHAFGTELNYVQHFKQLPGALAGIGLSTNWTWVNSLYKLPIPDANNLTTITRNSVLPSTSRNSANFELLYDLPGLNLSLGAYYTSRNIFGVNADPAVEIWTQDRLSVDFGSQYHVSDLLAVYLNVKNLTNTPLKFTEGKGENRVIQREFYSTTLTAGVTLKF